MLASHYAKTRTFASSLLVSLLFNACLFETRHEIPAPPKKSLAYSVKISSATGGLLCSVFVHIERWPTEEPVVFQLPPYYPDNPAMPVPGVDREKIRATNSAGVVLSVRDTSESFTQGGGKWIVLPLETKTLSYAVDLDPGDPARFGPPVPGLETGVQMLDGSQLFILPAMGNSLSTHWRNPLSLSLNWLTETGVILMGESNSFLRSNYQLMFFRGAVNPVRTFDFLAGAHRVTLYGNDRGDTLDFAALAARFQRWIPLLESHLGPLPQEHLWIGTNTIHAGIEGTGGYWFRQEYSENAEVHLHELTHTFVGVLQGDYDDAWWKEGVTNYFGKIMAVEDGYYSDSSAEVAGYLLQPRAEVPSIVQYALSDPAIRDRFFHPLDSNYTDIPPEDFYSLLYGKGSQAAMLIDAWLLRNSGGKHDLYEAVRDLFQSGETGFTRPQLAKELVRLTGQRADTLLQSLCDQPGAFTTARLQQGFLDLQTFNRFKNPPPVLVRRNSHPIQTETRKTQAFGKY